MNFKRDWKQLIPGIVLSIAAGFLICVFAPLEMYFTNIEEFWFDIYTLLPLTAAGFAVVAVSLSLLMLILFIINEKVYYVGMLIEAVIFVCTYIQGNYMVASLPSLDGSQIDWNKFTGNMVASAVMWIIVVAALVVCVKFFGFKKVNKVAGYVSGCMILMFLVTLTSVSISNEGWQHKSGADLIMTDNGILEFSENNNFIILLLDAVDGEEFNELVESSDEYKDVFNDFTCFSDTLGAYPYTKHSIPFVLTGQWYENKGKFSDYYKESVKNASLFSKLESNNYKMSLYEDELVMEDSYADRFDNIIDKNKGISSYKKFAELEGKLVAFRYLPYGFKSYVSINMNDFKSIRGKHKTEDMNSYTLDNKQFYDYITSKEVTKTQDNCFKFIHIEGAHVPFIYNEQMEYIDENEGTYEDNMKACITIVKTYLQRLKDNDAYNNSVIMVMSDHGYNYEDAFGRQNPILYVKGAEENHVYKTSEAPVSYADLNIAYDRLIDGENSDNIFDYKEGDERERRFIFYYFETDNHMVEYITKGKAYNEEEMQETGNVYDEVD